ncbi:hypothetical protein CENSYa_0742 [Cenarchaeum symbiosum A]|uniref:Uncharacterized protein n=1 Tax=Cenarchaeum symbiosum (strain A) TaxID=414004 RepID=A0RVK8_CENSY|nr:hypothetical protein CENSYa_0742 [Cenarchaeum symbiosum A]
MLHAYHLLSAAFAAHRTHSGTPFPHPRACPPAGQLAGLEGLTGQKKVLPPALFHQLPGMPTQPRGQLFEKHAVHTLEWQRAPWRVSSRSCS